MSVFSSRPALRWLVPAAAAVAVIGGGAAVGTLAAAAEPTLPAAQRGRSCWSTCRPPGSTGCPAPSCSAPTSACRRCPALGGERRRRPRPRWSPARNTLRVWYAGPDKARVALLGTLGETDVIRNGRDVWIWASRGNTATHYAAARADAARRGRSRAARRPAGHPAGGGRRWRSPRSTRRTEVTTGRHGRRSPGGTRTSWCSRRGTRRRWSARCGSRSTPTEHVPLRVEVFAEGRRRARRSRWRSRRSASTGRTPSSSRFNPPPGAKVTRRRRPRPPGRARQPAEAAGARRREAADAGRRRTVVGEGWTHGRWWPRLPTASRPQGRRRRPTRRAGAARQPAEGQRRLGQRAAAAPARCSACCSPTTAGVLVGAVAPERLYEAAAPGRPAK